MFQNGARIHVNGDKSLTAIDGGSRLYADNTNGKPVKGVQIESELSSFAASNYREDAILNQNVIDKPSCLDSFSMRNLKLVVPSVVSSYWLSDIAYKYGYKLQGVANIDGNSLTNTYQVSGLTNDKTIFIDSSMSFDGYDLCSDITTRDFMQPANSYLFNYGLGVELKEKCKFKETVLNRYIKTGSRVYNSPINMDEEHSDTLSHGMYWIKGYVSFNDGIPLVMPCHLGQTIKKNTIVALNVPYTYLSNLNRDRLFRGGFDGTTFGYVTAFATLEEDARVNNAYYPYEGRGEGMVTSVTGTYHYVDKDTLINGVTVSASSHDVRPAYDLDLSKIAFFRDAENKDTSISSTFAFAPSSILYSTERKIAVVKSNAVTVTNGISDTSLISDRKDSKVDYSNNTIYVPYNSKTLILKASALSPNNATHITGLINYNGVKRYAALGTPASDLTIDLTDILDTKKVGSKQSISFYAEKINGDNTSDEISDTPVTITLEVAQGPEQTINYSLDGGSGTAPASTSIRAGKQYQLADGSNFSKESNKFSAWQMTYTPYGETESKTRIVSSNETIVVPDAQGKAITMTALYSGIKASKTTETRPFNAVVTWDANAPVGYVASFGDSTGTFNEDKSIRYDKVRVSGESVVLPSGPSVTPSSKFFVGWFTEPEGGSQIFGAVNVTSNITYYAQWQDASFIAAAVSKPGNPIEIEGERTAINDANVAAKNLAIYGTGSPYYQQYASYMNNDSYHLYTLLKGSGGIYLDPDDVDSWVEFRIVHVGQHDNDGSGLTFQAVHMLPNPYFMNSSQKGIVSSWESCELRTRMQSDGDIYNMFDPSLTALLLNITKPSSKGVFWIPSYSELSGATTDNVIFDGSQFEFWKKQNVSPDGSDYDTPLCIEGRRSGVSIVDGSSSGPGRWWERSAFTYWNDSFLYVEYNGSLKWPSNIYIFEDPPKIGVVPCFSM